MGFIIGGVPCLPRPGRARQPPRPRCRRCRSFSSKLSEPLAYRLGAPSTPLHDRRSWPGLAASLSAGEELRGALGGAGGVGDALDRGGRQRVGTASLRSATQIDQTLLQGPPFHHGRLASALPACWLPAQRAARLPARSARPPEPSGSLRAPQVAKLAVVRRPRRDDGATLALDDVKQWGASFGDGDDSLQLQLGFRFPLEA